VVLTTLPGRFEQSIGWKPRSLAIPLLRRRVIEILIEAGFRNREDRLPTKGSGGTFAVVGNIGVSVYAEWWNGDERALLERMAAALRDAGLEVEDRGDRLGVPYVVGVPPLNLPEPGSQNQ
jgi:hypothetical protein